MSTTARETTRRLDDRSRGRSPRPTHGSRDFTRGGTAVLDHSTRNRGGAAERRHGHLSHRTAAPNRPVRQAPENLHATPVRTRGTQRKLGSKQVVSVRGRRVANSRRTTLLAKLSGLVIVMLIGGVALAMWLSGVSTEQTFRMQQLVSEEAQLNNQLETLNRDLESASSAAEIARRAADMGMAIPNQPGVLAVGENGDIAEQRPVEAGTRPIIDVNGKPVEPDRASSNPVDTEDLGDNLDRVPEGQAPMPPQNSQPSQPAPAVVPYEASAPAPGAGAEESGSADEQAGEDAQ